MRAHTLAAPVLLTLITVSSAQSLPPAVAAHISSTEASCVSGPPRMESGFITRRDVNGDGIPDYILDYEYLLCGKLPDFCGSGGCGEVVFVSLKGGFVKALDEQGGKFQFKRIGGRPAVILGMSGFACGKIGAASCSKTWVWNGERFSPAH